MQVESMSVVCHRDPPIIVDDWHCELAGNVPDAARSDRHRTAAQLAPPHLCSTQPLLASIGGNRSDDLSAYEPLTTSMLRM